MIGLSRGWSLCVLGGLAAFLSGCSGDSKTTAPPVTTAVSISSVSPTSGAAGSAVALTVNGAGFVSGSTVVWGTTNLTTVYVGATQLTATATAANVGLAAATIPVKVANPDGTSTSALSFTVNALPLPTITSLTPATAVAGGSAFTLVVAGTGFRSGAQVAWNGVKIPATTVLGTTQVSAPIPATSIAAAAAVPVTVVNTDNGDTSAASTFTVTAPVRPSLTSLSPSTATAGGAAFTLTVSGAGFVSGATVRWGGVSRTTTVVSATQLTASIATADIATAGTAMVDVTQQGVSSTNQLAFTVQAPPQPTITALAANTATAGAAAFTLTVTGTNFFNDSKVQWNGTDRTTTFASGTQLTAAIAAADIATAGTANVTVVNPASEGGASTSTAFTITAPAVLPGIIQLISATPAGVEGDKPSYRPWVSGDGRYVAFPSAATDLISADTNAAIDVFLRDTCVGASGCTPSTSRVSVQSGGSELPYGTYSDFTAMSTSARLVAFDVGYGTEADLRDTCVSIPSGCTPSTTPVSVPNGGGAAQQVDPGITISADGRFVGFTSDSTILVAGVTVTRQSYVRDTCSSTTGPIGGCTPGTTLASIGNGGTTTIPTNGGFMHAISKNGRYVLFHALSANVMPAGVATDGRNHLYMRDTCTGVVSACTPVTTMIDVAVDGTTEGNSGAGGSSDPASISDDGRYVLFESAANNLVTGSPAGSLSEAYLRDTCNGAASGCVPSTILVSTTDGGVGATWSNYIGTKSLTSDGRFAVFVSSNPATPAQQQIYVRDLCLNAGSSCTPTTTKVSVDPSNMAGTAPGFQLPSISADGHYVAFTRTSLGGFAGTPQVFLAKTGY